MPVFLDKLDFFKVSASDIRLIHLDDQRIQKKFGCSVMASWFDQKRKTTFYLIDAPDLDSVKEMHCHVHHSYPLQIMEVEEDLIESFLNNIERPKSQLTEYTQPSVLVMKLYWTDIFSPRDYLKRKSLFEDFKAWSQILIKKNKGRIIESTWDGKIYIFDSIAQSFKVALQMQQKLDVYIKTNKGSAIILNIGIDGGRPMNENCDLSEEITNLPRRLCCIAGNNQIVVSSLAKEQFLLDNYGILIINSNLKSLNYKDEQFLTRLMDIIEPNYLEDLKIVDLCKIIGESRSQLYRKIIDVTNLSPIELINEFRLKKAIELMHRQQGYNISQIAFGAGFNSLSYFSRRFKKRFGHLPSVYRHRRCVTHKN